MMRLSGLVKPLSGYMSAAILMGLAGHICAAFITVFGGFAVLDVLGFLVPVSKTAAFVMVCVFAVIRGVLRYGEQACNHFIAFKLLALIRDKVFRALRRLSPAKLETRDKGDLISLITSDVELLEVFYAHTISPSAIALLFSLILCLFIGSYHWSLGLLAVLAYVTVGIVIPVVSSKLGGNTGMNFRNKSGELSAFVLDSMRGISETIQYSQGEKRLSEMNRRSDELASDERKMKIAASKNTAFTNTVILLFDLGMLSLASYLYMKGIIGFEAVVIPTIALMSSFGPVIALAALGSTLQHTFAAGNRVLDILDDIPVTKEIEGRESIQFKGAKAENVTFSYGEETILKDVSVDVQEHSIVGIIGKSGSGKSTLLKLLMRFWDVQRGSVKISDTDVSEINTGNLRDMESFVTQETQLFHDSIANNLRIAKLDATDEEIESACKKASVHDFIMSLPKGYYTPVGELGDTLSGGEKQRLGLARAFLHNAPFILLDEPTSNLDSLNEAAILKALGEEREGKTVILVSHRESTMRIADKVYSVEHGRMS